jgi:hypothetical protein
MGNQNGQNRETGNIVYTRRRQTKQRHITMCGHHYTQTNTNNVNKAWALLQTNTNNVNKAWALLQTTRGKDKPNKHK